jgi:hypothetical protein
MKLKVLGLLLCVGIVGASGLNTYGQRNIDPAIDRDPVLEQDAKHNLDVARNYFLLKKAYKAVLMRFEETFAAYPTF